MARVGFGPRYSLGLSCSGLLGVGVGLLLGGCCPFASKLLPGAAAEAAPAAASLSSSLALFGLQTTSVTTPSVFFNRLAAY